MASYEFRKYQLKKLSLRCNVPFFLGILTASNDAGIASMVHDTLNNIATVAEHYAAQGNTDSVLEPVKQILTQLMKNTLQNESQGSW